MRRRRAAVAIGVCAVSLGASVACSAVLGIADFTPGDGGAGLGTTSGGHDGAGSDGNGAGEASGPAPCISGTDAAASGTGCPCTQEGQLGCNGNAQTETLICTQGVWTSRSTCTPGQNCDSRIGGTQGNCETIDPSCVGAAPGQPVCVGASLIQCGPDLVSESPIMTCSNMACVDGGCSGVCVPGATQCSGHGLQTCGSGGQWQAASACSESCSDGGCALFPSCQNASPGAGKDCGPTGGGAVAANDCCTSFEVSGATFDRSYDGVSPGDMSAAYPASVTGYRLDGYEVTVGRFRNFVTAVVGGWVAPAGSGKHANLNGGSGLTAVGGDAGSGSEPGWSAAWNTNLATTQSGWNSNLQCDPAQSWTTSPGSHEHRPINCITWYEAYAFCIWDEGYLPSEAEWNFAASGGTDQRVYPWSSPPMSPSIDCTYANYDGSDGGTACSATNANDVGSESPKGDGKFGQSDLAGNVWEWNLDDYATYVTPCSDCANLAASPARVARGGSFNLVASALTSSYRGNYAPSTRDSSVGVRCARMP